MAKQESDIAPPEALAASSTMKILGNARASAKPPTMKGASGGVPQNKKR